VQAYCYAAFRARAHFAAGSGDKTGRRYWLDRAARLKTRFNDAFWLPQQGYYAVGLDADKQPIDAVTSNIGHCLWTGIVDRDKAPAVAERLLSPEMFSGWGIRTLATTMHTYNPISYHNGSVWPHDNALAVAGLMRYGFVDQAQRVVAGLIDASRHFGHRLPELFCGFSREQLAAPIRYPSACAPQAWAAASPFLLLRALLRFDPELPVNQLFCSPEVPERYLPLRVAGLHVRDLNVDVSVHAEGWLVTGLQGSGLTLVCPEPGTAGPHPPGEDLADRGIRTP
jgi:glycogen debranching enzyme